MRRYQIHLIILLLLIKNSWVMAEQEAPAMSVNEKAWLTAQVENDRLEDNFYVALRSIFYPNDHYREVGAEKIRERYREILENPQALTKEELESRINFKCFLSDAEDCLRSDEPLLSIDKRNIEGEIIADGELFSCYQYGANHCIQTILDNQENLQFVFANNAQLLARYRDISKKATYLDTQFLHHEGLDWEGFGWHYPYLKLSNLRLSQVIYAFESGDFDEALEILEDEKRILKLYLSQESTPSLIDAMILVVRAQVYSQFLAQLLDSSYLDDHLADERVEALFQPYNQDQLMMVNRVIASELSDVLKQRSDTIRSLKKEPQQYGLNMFETNLALTWFDKEVGISKRQREWQSTFHESEIQLVLADIEVADNLRKLDRYNHEEIGRYFAEKGLTVNQLFNIINPDFDFSEIEQYDALASQYLALAESGSDLRSGKALLQYMQENLMARLFFDFSSYQDYVHRFNVAVNYHHLVALKYQIKRDQITDVDIPQFLELMGDLAINRITKKRFNWNAEKRILSTPLPKEAKCLPASVKSGTTHFELSL